MDIMHTYIEPDFSIPFPEEFIPLQDFKEKAEAACRTAELLALNVTPTEDELKEAEQLTYSIVGNDEKTTKKILKKQYTPAIYKTVSGVLDEFSHRVVDNAMQIRLLVTNKLIIESNSDDARIRLRALEMLGKITDVGLFTEKSEVTVTHRSTDELVNGLREKLHRLMHPDDIIDAEVVEVNGEAIDIDKELGLDSVHEVNGERIAIDKELGLGG